eukprot:CAMPEP_0171327890 /NCGR_PEP_ID=MMETSP0878-20121228/310_1 /TAXON_ID=67004 /ORGANISM="Thalassiosira weissflogii, Strain CCMP1336" /LENGTH=76 /DNA_ID=CAMNT_0011827699 /DNA_START=300 /DNA_END=530 /DNA_ORIENTATION=+
MNQNTKEMKNYGERRNAMKTTDDAYKRALEIRAFEKEREAGELIAQATTDVATNEKGNPRASVKFVTQGSVTNEQN